MRFAEKTALINAAVAICGPIVLGLAACQSDQTYVPMTAAIPTSTLDQATVLPINAARQQQQRASQPAPLVPPLFTGGSQSIVVAPLQTRFVTDQGGAVTPDGRTDDDGQAVFRALGSGGARLSGALVASVCRLQSADQGRSAGTIQYDLRAGTASSNGDQQCSATLSDFTQVGATYSWNSSASWSGGRLVLSGTAAVTRTNSNLSANDAEHVQVEEQATLRISGGNCTLESYRLVERKSRPNSAFFNHQTHIATGQPLPGATCQLN